MKIAALVQAHHKPENLQRLVGRLTDELWQIYVHLDRKTNKIPFEHITGSVKFLDKRIDVRWGGFSQVEATLDLMREAIQDHRNTHFYLMSGQCYPIKTNTYIEERLAAAVNGGNFINIFEMPIPNKPLKRIEKIHIYDWNLSHRSKAFLQALLGHLPSRSAAKLLRGIALYGGSSWFMFSRSTVMGMLNFLDQNPWYIRAFRLSECADEMFFQTLFMHLGYIADGPSPTAVNWIQGKSNPEDVTQEYVDSLQNDERFMARKFTNYYPD